MKARNNLNGVNRWAKITLQERFWAQVNKQGNIPPHCKSLGHCWEWTAASDGKYGQIMAEGRPNQKAHRVAWFLETGAWPTLSVLHKCDNTFCVRFSHLFEGTYKTNAQDTRNKERGTAKLSLKDVENIRKALAMGMQGKLIAKTYSVTPAAISALKTGKNWKGVA